MLIAAAIFSMALRRGPEMGVAGPRKREVLLILIAGAIEVGES